jgi:hypothetical protein
VLFSGTYSYLATVANGGSVSNSSGFDIIFTSDAAGLTKLDHEIESYTATTGAVNFWVRVPTVSNTTDTVIYLWYGNSAISTSQENQTGVWDSNFMGVWHLKETATDEQFTATHTDSTSNANNATQGGNDSVAGKIANGQNFDNVNDYIRAPNTASLQPTTALTISGWVNTRTFGSTFDVNPVLRKGLANPNNYQLFLHSNNVALSINSSDDPPLVAGTTPMAADTWYYVASTFNGTTAIVYLNGVSDGSAALSATISTDTRSVYMGGRDDSADISDGWLDEVRLSNIARSADWILTEYNNQNSPGTFYTVGTAVNFGVIDPRRSHRG